MMTLMIDLPVDLEQELRDRATRTGQDVTALVVQAVREQIARSRTFDETCAPFAQAVEASGMTDREYGQFFEEVRDRAWHDRQGKRE
jgi:hypothetical protein